MNSMFKGCTNLKTLRVTKFNTEKVTEMREMFSTIPQVASLDLSSFNTTKCTSYSNIFAGNNNLQIKIRQSLCSNILRNLPSGVKVIDA